MNLITIRKCDNFISCILKNIVNMKQENNSSEEMDEPKIGSAALYLYIVIMCIIILMIICGNILTIMAIFKFEHLRTKTNALVCSLSFADLFVGISLVPDVIYSILDKYGEEDSVDVIIYYSILQTAYFISVLHIACIASERYIFVMYPLRYHSLITVKVIKLLLCICWIVPILVGFVFVVTVTLLGIKYFMHFYVGASIFYVLVGLVESFVYIRILYVVDKQQERIASEQNAVAVVSRRSQINRNSQHKSTLALGIVVIMYVLLWSPICITNILEYFSSLQDNLAFEICTSVAEILSSFNSAVNCIIYTWKYTVFRKAYVKIIKIC